MKKKNNFFFSLDPLEFNNYENYYELNIAFRVCAYGR